LDKQEKLIVLSNDDINHIKNIFSDNYKKYQLTMSGNLKEVITSKQINQLSNILDKKAVILAT
jgi:Iap family predicted aminopeptidase